MNNFTNNILLDVDSYKISHFEQYPPKTQYVSSYIESRGGKFDYTTFFGLQAWIMNLRVPTVTEIMEANEIFTANGYNFNLEGWLAINRLGYLPIQIQAVPEGTNVPTSNVLVQIRNTDPRFPWLTSWLETSLLRAIWYPTTVCTISNTIRRICEEYVELTCDEGETLVDFMLNDFGSRGASSFESSALGGTAHLVNFMGSDNIPAIPFIRRYYGATMPSGSIPAAEHSTITSWGRENEALAYKNMINKFDGEGKIFAVVSDSYDIFNAVSNIWGGELKADVQNLKGRLVVRPDSGDPVETPIKVIELLMEKFGYTVNSKGYKVLPPFIRVIQGDGINEKTIEEILNRLAIKDIAASNINFGMGGALLQGLDRDTQRFAMKASAVMHNDLWTDVYKDPVGGGKTSKRGRLALTKDEYGFFKTVRQGEGKNLLVNVYEDGQILKIDTLDTIRTRAKMK